LDEESVKQTFTALNFQFFPHPQLLISNGGDRLAKQD